MFLAQLCPEMKKRSIFENRLANAVTPNLENLPPDPGAGTQISTDLGNNTTTNLTEIGIDQGINLTTIEVTTTEIREHFGINH